MTRVQNEFELGSLILTRALLILSCGTILAPTPINVHTSCKIVKKQINQQIKYNFFKIQIMTHLQHARIQAQNTNRKLT